MMSKELIAQTVTEQLRDYRATAQEGERLRCLCDLLQMLFVHGQVARTAFQQAGADLDELRRDYEQLSSGTE